MPACPPNPVAASIPQPKPATPVVKLGPTLRPPPPLTCKPTPTPVPPPVPQGPAVLRHCACRRHGAVLARLPGGPGGRLADVRRRRPGRHCGATPRAGPPPALERGQELGGQRRDVCRWGRGAAGYGVVALMAVRAGGKGIVSESACTHNAQLCFPSPTASPPARPPTRPLPALPPYTRLLALACACLPALPTAGGLGMSLALIAYYCHLGYLQCAMPATALAGSRAAARLMNSATCPRACDVSIPSPPSPPHACFSCCARFCLIPARLLCSGRHRAGGHRC